MYVLVLAFLRLLFMVVQCFSLRKDKPKALIFEKKYSGAVKVILTLLIVVHHLTRSAQLDSLPLGRIFHEIGFVCVAGFFAVSGWGTAASLKISADGRHYWGKN